MYVVTGVTGNTGSVVAKRLLDAGKKVCGIGRSFDRMQRFARVGGQPFVADLTDREALVVAFADTEGVLVMIPPQPGGPDFRAHQDAVSESLASALERAKVKYAVTISSIGADKANKTGTVAGLHLLEERLNRIVGLNVLHLRPGYYMENTLIQAELIHQTGMAMGALLPELRVPMIATHDVGAAAADALLERGFSSHQTHELLGPRDITMSEVAAIIGNAVGIPNLKYVQAPEDQVRGGMLQSGIMPDLVKLILETATALNMGHIKALEERSANNTTPTTFETFVEDEFVPRYRGIKAAA